MTVAAQIISDNKLEIFLDVLHAFQFFFLTYILLSSWVLHKISSVYCACFHGHYKPKLIKLYEVMRDLQRKKTLKMKVLKIRVILCESPAAADNSCVYAAGVHMISPSKVWRKNKVLGLTVLPSSINQHSNAQHKFIFFLFLLSL